MSTNLTPAVEPAIAEQLALRSVSVLSATKFLASFSSVCEALEYPARDLPSGSIVVNAHGFVCAKLERQWTAAGRAIPTWVLEVST